MTAIKGPVVNYFIQTELVKPAANLPVMAWDGKQWVRAMWVPRYGLEQGFDHEEDWTDYNEKDGNFYWPEGWYELQSHGGEEKYWYLIAGATDWMPLPPPKEQS
jgi:hypothetical protein